MVDATDTSKRSRGDRPARRGRRFGQPESTAALWPSQRRAAHHRAARREENAAEYWLRRLTRS